MKQANALKNCSNKICTNEICIMQEHSVSCKVKKKNGFNFHWSMWLQSWPQTQE